MVTLDQLENKYNYDPDTGIFTHKLALGGVKVGSKAGNTGKRGYVRIQVGGRHYAAHHMAWLMYYKSLPESNLDHINGIRDDNRICNLREADQWENSKNQKMRNTNNSGVIGVCWYAQTKKWHAQIYFKYERIHLGYFDCIEEATKARKEAEVKYNYHKNHGRNKDD